MIITSIQGFIFNTVLVFLSLFSLTSLYTFMHISESMKRHERFWVNYHYRIRANQILKKIEQEQLQGRERCIIPNFHVTELSAQSLSWWELNTCSANVNEFRYYYAVELLGEDVCGIIKKNVHQLFTAKYERVTLYAIPDKVANAKYMIQSTVAIPNHKIDSPCNNAYHPVYEGRQSWREI